MAGAPKNDTPPTNIGSGIGSAPGAGLLDEFGANTFVKTSVEKGVDAEGNEAHDKAGGGGGDGTCESQCVRHLVGGARRVERRRGRLTSGVSGERSAAERVHCTPGLGAARGVVGEGLRDERPRMEPGVFEK